MKKFLIPVQCLALKSLDISFSLFIATPILVTNWFSLWIILDALFLSTDNEGKIISFVAGVCGQFTLLFYQDVLAKIFQSNGIILVFVSRVLLVISNVVNICFWRALWSVYDSISAVDDNSIVMNIVQNSVILMALGVYRNVVAAPFVIQSDHDTNPFDNKTFLRRSVSDYRSIA